MSLDAAIPVDAALVRRLLADQVPQWSDLPLKPISSSGTDNAIFRLGEDLAVRLPRVDWAVAQPQKEARWLPGLAAQLPLPIPEPLVLGEPTFDYPSHWTVCRWLDGEPPTAGALPNEAGLASDLARFLTALHAADPAGGPEPGAHNFHRGVALSRRDAYTRKAIGEVGEFYDPAVLTAAWEASVAAPPWPRAASWIHGDLQGGNLLCVDGRLSGVIDFGGLAVGDPACDLMVAWTLLSARGRRVFRVAMGVDAASWRRGRGWALSTALVALPYYRERNPAVAEAARRTIGEVLADPG